MFIKTAVLLTTIALITFTVPAAKAATATCTVTEIRDTAVILDCGKTADKLKAGETVKIKTAKKKAVEGC